MESTGVYWILVWNILQKTKRFELTLVNPQHARAIPGKKTDRIDCERLAELHQYGLVRASFIPPAPIRELRDLTRRRIHLQQDRNRVINRIRRLLETANIKLASVMSDVVGQTDRSILDGLVLRVSVTEHFQFVLSGLLEELDFLDKQVSHIEDRIRHKLALTKPIFCVCARFRVFSV